MKLIDRSRHETWWTCPQLRHWTYDHQGTGLDLGGSADADLGSAVHAAIAATLQGQPPPPQTLSGEPTWIAESLALLWAHARLPQLQADYEVVALGDQPLVEREWIWRPDPDLGVMVRLDGVVRHRATGGLRILEHKTSKWVTRAEWQTKWHLSLQVFLEVAALQALFPEAEIDAVEITGLMTGQEKDDKDFGLVRWGPVTIAYTARGEWSSKYQKGWEKVYLPRAFSSPAEALATVSSMVDALAPIEVTPPTPAQLDLFVAQLVAIETALPPPYRNLTACQNWGRECLAFGLCWRGEDPSGYAPRIPHHDTELS